MRFPFPVCLLVLVTQPGFSQPEAGFDFPATPAGRGAKAYIEAFNADSDSAMRRFFEERIPTGREAQVPAGERMERFRRIKAELGALRPQAVVKSDEGLIVLNALSRGGEILRLEFRFEETPPYGLIAIGIDQADMEEAGAPKESEEMFVSAATHLIDSLDSGGAFSGVILVAKNHVPVLQRACGYADRAQKVRNTVSTRFNLGSINKTFTTLAIHQLAAKGLLSFDDPIGRFLTGYPNREAAKKVTIRHLLEMSSGIGDFFGERYEKAVKDSLRSITDFLPLFADLPLEFEPGTQRRYSNGGYVVLGAVIEEVSGMDYYSYVADNIFDPAGMISSGWFERNTGLPDIATGYTIDGESGEIVTNKETLPGRGSSAGGGYSTAMDLLRYASALDAGTICPKDYPGRGGLAIAGGSPGVNAALEWDPAKGYLLVVLANLDPPVAERVAQLLRSWLPEQ